MSTCARSHPPSHVPTSSIQSSKPAKPSSSSTSITPSGSSLAKSSSQTCPPPSVPVSTTSTATSSTSSSSTAAKDGVLTPSIETIWKSFVAKGHEDVELLKLLLLTKSKEDERLSALDNLRTEQLRAANTMALHQYFYQYSAFYAAQQQQQAHLLQQQQQQQQQSQNRAVSPYSPTSPPPVVPSSASLKPSTKRPRAPSDASTGSNDSSISSASTPPAISAPVKKPRLAPSTKNASAKTPPPPPPPTFPNGKPTHQDVMELLRKKCQANQGTSSSPPSSSSSTSIPSMTIRKPSSSPPLRHSLMLRPALPLSSGSSSPPPSLEMPQIQQPSEGSALSPVVEEGGAEGRAQGQGIDRLAMLLRAGEMKAETD
ncbi:uncharacterized protein JCM6883_005869 [Sporobolomyces salmoneus]|uniref:uncharacterized protein n=1 Tax=Sporobolomyces salmoneus TaxID=183962 RepID=UPI003181BDAE